MLMALIGAVALIFSAAVLVARPSTVGAAAAPACSMRVLTLSPGFTEAATGNVGTPIVITNNGSVACSITGFPTVVSHTEAPSPHAITFVRRPRSQIYVVARVKTVVVSPQGTASFGISYVDGDDQRYGEGRDCLINFVTVRLPHVALARTVTFKKGSDGFGGPINSCFTGFEFGLTPIVKGSTPPEA
jgi:hypothetical protein